MDLMTCQGAGKLRPELGLSALLASASFVSYLELGAPVLKGNPGEEKTFG